MRDGKPTQQRLLGHLCNELGVDEANRLGRGLCALKERIRIFVRAFLPTALSTHPLMSHSVLFSELFYSYYGICQSTQISTCFLDSFDYI